MQVLPNMSVGSLTAGIVLSTCVLAGCSEKSDSPTVTIRQATWKVELATTNEQRYQGLSGRDSLPPGSAMLFIYPSPKVLDFCMRDCVIPLDIAFIDADLRVVTTYTMAVEPDLVGRAIYSSLRPAQFVLELPAGALGNAGVRPGDKVAFSDEIHEATKEADGP